MRKVLIFIAIVCLMIIFAFAIVYPAFADDGLPGGILGWCQRVEPHVEQCTYLPIAHNRLFVMGFPPAP